MDLTKFIKDVEKFVADVETNTNVNRAQTDLLKELTNNIFEIKEAISKNEKDGVEIDNWQEKAIDDLKKDINILKELVSNSDAEKKILSLEKKLEKAIEKEKAQNEKIKQVDEDLEKTKLGNAKVDSAQSAEIDELKTTDIEVYAELRDLRKEVDENTEFRVAEIIKRASAENKIKRALKSIARFILQVAITYVLVRITTGV